MRELIANGCVAMPGVFNAATARMVERAGFDAVYISGAGLCNATAGVPDVGLLTLTEVTLLAGYVARAVKIPCIVDADTGFGGADNAARTVRELEARGPGRLPHRRPGISEALRASRGQVARRDRGDEREDRSRGRGAKRDKDFLLIARTDARAVESFDKAVERAQSYLAAGADAIFPEALQGREEFRDFAKAVDAPLLANMTEFGKSPLMSRDELAELGYRMVIYPQTAFRVSMFATGQMLSRFEERPGRRKSWLDRMQTRKELYELLDYDPTADAEEETSERPTSNVQRRT